MESQFWGMLEAHPFFVAIILFGGLVAVATVISARSKIHDALGYKTRSEVWREEYETNEKRRDKQIDDMWKEIKDMREETKSILMELREVLRNVKEANIMVLGDCISQRCSSYLQDGCIPADEVVEIQNMYETYKNIDGNHGIDRIYEKTIAALPLSCPIDKEEEDK